MRAFFSVLIISLIAACGASTSTPAAAHGEHAALEVSGAWAAPTPNGVNVSAGYLTITNGASADDTLISASSPRAGRVEIHEMTMDGAVMRMRRVETLVAPAHGAVQLAPGQQHLMFYDVAQPFAIGETIPLTLRFEHAGEVSISLPVQRAPPAGHSGH